MRIIELFKVPFDFGFYTCIFPFHIVNDKQSKTFHIKTNTYQKTICGAVTFLSIFWMIRQIRQNVPTNARDPSEHFLCLYCLIFFFQKCYFIKTLWMDQEGILNIYRFLLEAQNSKKLPHVDISCKWINAGAIRVAAILNILICLIMVASGVETIPSVKATDSTLNYYQSWRKEMVNVTRFTLFLGTDVDTDVHVDSFLMTIGAIGYFFRRFLGAYDDFSQTVAIITVWVLVKSFVHNSLRHVSTEKKGEELTWVEIDTQFNGLKELVHIINEKFGVQILCLVTSLCLYFATRLDEILDALTDSSTADNGFANVFDKVKMICWLTFLFVNCVCILFFSADISYQVISH